MLLLTSVTIQLFAMEQTKSYINQNLYNACIMLDTKKVQEFINLGADPDSLPNSNFEEYWWIKAMQKTQSKSLNKEEKENKVQKISELLEQSRLKKREVEKKQSKQELEKDLKKINEKYTSNGNASNTTTNSEPSNNIFKKLYTNLKKIQKEREENKKYFEKIQKNILTIRNFLIGALLVVYVVIEYKQILKNTFHFFRF